MLARRVWIGRYGQRLWRERMNKNVSPQMFIVRVNNLRFIKKKSADALKELVSEYLKQFKQDFNGLCALTDIWLSMAQSSAPMVSISQFVECTQRNIV